MSDRLERGILRNRFPFVRIGCGQPPLIVLPELTLDNRTPSWFTASATAQRYRRLAAVRTLFVVGGRRGLPPTFGMEQLAGDYAELISSAWGRVDVLGQGSGGAVAQQLALDHPHLVDRLMLVVSGARLSDHGRSAGHLWQELAGTWQWARLRGHLAGSSLDQVMRSSPGPVRNRASELATAYTFLPGAGRRPLETDAADFYRTVSALLGHDTLARLGGLRAPTLIVGGSDDPFAPEPLLRETAAAIGGSTLRIYPGVGHGLPQQFARDLQDDLLAFLSPGPVGQRVRRSSAARSSTPGMAASIADKVSEKPAAEPYQGSGTPEPRSASGS